MNFISIGENCTCCRHLFLRSFRSESYPFDWACSNIESIIDFISDNYNQTELKIKRYNSSNKFVNGELFWPHHDKFLSNQKCYEYVSNCWNRFEKLMRSGKKLYFLSFTPLGYTPVHELMIKFSELIRKLYTDQFEIHCCYSTEDEDEKIEITEIEGIMYYEFHVKHHFCIDNDDWSGEKNNMDIWNEFFTLVKR